MAKGIDVSKWNEEIDWKKVEEATKSSARMGAPFERSESGTGIEFAMIREGYGRNNPNQVDKNFHTNIKNALDSGIHCGVYHYSYAVDVQDAINEANFCLENIKGYSLEYPVAFDIEDKSMKKLGKRTLTDICKAFCDTIEQHGYYAAIYTNVNWLENYLYKDELLPKYDLWLAEWNKDKPSYSCGLWQFSNKGCVYGINGDVDMNLSYKNYPKIIKNKGLNGFANDTNYFTYTVKKGDALWTLSKIFLGSGTKYKEIKKLNNLTKDTIYVGQILKIPK